MVAVNPFLPGMVLPGSVASTTAAVVILVAMVEASSVVSLVAPPPPAVAEEEETETPTTLGGGLHGSPSWSELKVLGDMAGTESKCPSMSHATEVVEIPSDNEADDVVELPVPSQELAMVQSEARPSSGLPEGDLEWPCPEDPSKVWFVLRDS